MSDMYHKLNELLQNADLVRAQEQLDAAVPRKRKTRRKKKKPQPCSSPERARSPSPSQHRPPAGHLSASYSAFQSPSSLKANYPRPQSAVLAPSFTASSPTPLRPLSAVPARPASATPAGPSARAVHEAHWRNVSPPKYTATSLKQPELGTVPGKYQSPPWSPGPCNERDPSRQEIDQPIKEARFKHVLAVPAHVLAQSLYHPNCPSDRARAKQLAEDLKVARIDRFQCIKERTRVEAELRLAQDASKGMEGTIRQLQEDNNALQEQVAGLLRSHKALTFERDQLAEQVRIYSTCAQSVSNDSHLRAQLAAAHGQVEELRAQLHASESM